MKEQVFNELRCIILEVQLQKLIKCKILAGISLSLSHVHNGRLLQFLFLEHLGDGVEVGEQVDVGAKTLGDGLGILLGLRGRVGETQTVLGMSLDGLKYFLEFRDNFRLLLIVLSQKSCGPGLAENSVSFAQ